MKRLVLLSVSLVGLLALTACGGGGGGSSPPPVIEPDPPTTEPEPTPDPEPDPEPTPDPEPDPTPDDVVEPPSGGWDHNKRTWSLESARIDREDAGQSGRRARSSYDGFTAIFPPHAGSYLHSDFTPSLFRTQGVATTRNGIPFTVSQASGPDRWRVATADQTAYGGWLTHSYFELVLERRSGADDAPAPAGFSLGNANFYDPPGSATWNGAVVAYEALGAGGPLYGSAQVVFDLGSATVDVMLRPESVAPISWHGLAVEGGRFRHAVLGDEIAGVFYGPQAEEVGGVFRRNLVTGAFGAVRE